VQNVSTSRGYQLLEKDLNHPSEYEDAESNADPVVVMKLDVQVFRKYSNTS